VTHESHSFTSTWHDNQHGFVVPSPACLTELCVMEANLAVVLCLLCCVACWVQCRFAKHVFPGEACACVVSDHWSMLAASEFVQEPDVSSGVLRCLEGVFCSTLN
jgi:hypothetical protein